MWNIKLPDIQVIYKREPHDLTPYQIKKGEKPDYLTTEEKELKSLLTTEYNKNVSYQEYLKLPKVRDLLDKEPSYEPIMWACYQVEHYNFGKRLDRESNGSKINQRTGMIAQTVIADYLSDYRPNGANDTYDHGIDFKINGANVDIKCMGRTSTVEHDWVHNLIKSQMENKLSETDYYLFCSVDTKDSILQVCGYVQKSLIPKCAEEIKKGDWRTRRDGTKFQARADMFEVSQDVLCAINNLDDLDTKISKKNIVSNPNSEDAIKCVWFYNLIEQAKTDVKARAKLIEYRKGRFAYLLKHASFTDMRADFEWGAKCSLDFQLSKAEENKKIMEKYTGNLLPLIENRKNENER